MGTIPAARFGDWEGLITISNYGRRLRDRPGRVPLRIPRTTIWSFKPFMLLVVLMAGFSATFAAGAAFADATERPSFVNANTGEWLVSMVGGAHGSLYYGSPGDQPLVGDWDCDGLATPGAYRSSDDYVYLRNTVDTGPGTVRFFLGMPGDIALAGDFDGDGCDTISIYRQAEGRVYVANSLGADDGFFVADYDFFFGAPGDTPFVGDFDGDGFDTVGLHRESTGFVYFTNDVNPAGLARTHNSFFYGEPGDVITAGDWNGDGIDTVAILRPADGNFYVRFSNSHGPAQEVLPVPEGQWTPVAGITAVPDAIPVPEEPDPEESGPVVVHPGDPLADMVNTRGPGTEFLIKAGVHVGHALFPASGMKFIGEPGAVLDGGGTPFNAFFGADGIDGVEIRGLEIRNYRVGLFDGAISARVVDDWTSEGRDWLVVGNNIHSNGGAGISLGSGMRVIDNVIHDNRQIGISGIADNDTRLDRITIEGNEIYRNSMNPDYEFGFHEGGIKTLFTSDLLVRNNDIYGNGGVALYCDELCESGLIENNSMYDNWGRSNGGGVFLELSEDMVVRNNFIGSGGHLTYPYAIRFFGGITIGESHNIVIEGNLVEVNDAAGIVVRNCCSERRDPSSGIVVDSNTVRSTDGGPVTVGLTDGNSSVDLITYRNNSYVGNVDFYWNGSWLGFQSWQDIGQDVAGSSSFSS